MERTTDEKLETVITELTMLKPRVTEQIRENLETCIAWLKDTKTEHAEQQRLLKVGLEIHDEYLSQIATCVSQDYGRLNQFPIDCAKLGIELDADKG